MAKLFEHFFLKKGDKLIEDIAIKMMCTEDNSPDPEMEISDVEILEDIKRVENIEATDRDGRTLLINAAFYGREAVVKYLLSKGANTDAADNDGYTALHAASQEGFAEIVDCLIAAGATVNAVDSAGNTPLIVARHRSVIEILARNGADAKIKNNKGISANDMFKNYPDILSLFE